MMIDASVAAKWIIPREPLEEEVGEVKDVIVERRVSACAPSLLTYELASIVSKTIKRGVIEDRDGVKGLKALSELRISLVSAS